MSGFAVVFILSVLRQIAEEIRHLINVYEQTIPTILEIPSKNAQYDETKDSVVQRVLKLLGRD